MQNIFYYLVSKYSNDQSFIDELWNETFIAYSHKKRHYNDLSHLWNLYNELIEIKSEIVDWDTMLFSLFYHDIVYNPLKLNNEEKSAELAVLRLKKMNIPKEKIDLCFNQILASKSHLISEVNDINLFTDADLSILGTNWNTYLNYSQNIRKEYSLYPDIIYNPGRKKVLTHFLTMNKIFKTDYFYNKYEQYARLNLQNELSLY